MSKINENETMRDVLLSSSELGTWVDPSLEKHELRYVNEHAARYEASNLLQNSPALKVT